MDDLVLELVTTTSLSAAEAIDYIAIEECGVTQSEWAQSRDVSQQAVSKNVASARSKLGDS